MAHGSAQYFSVSFLHLSLFKPSLFSRPACEFLREKIFIARLVKLTACIKGHSYERPHLSRIFVGY